VQIAPLMRQVLRSKIHRAIVTEANVDYVGSITIDEDLLDAVGLWPFEKVLVVSVTNGERLETYALPGERGSGVVCMNGGAAHRIRQGHLVIVMGFELTDKPLANKVALVDERNRLLKVIEQGASSDLI